MDLNDFDFQLDKSFIAQEPVVPRDSSKLLVFDTQTGEVIHSKFSELGKFLRGDDVMVVNSSKVVRARILFDGKEIFLLKKLGDDRYEVLVKPGRFFKLGKEFAIDDQLSAKVEGINEDGTRVLRFSFEGDLGLYLEKIGEVPLPPYIDNKGVEEEKYQTVYACDAGSVAAPTAGLHFTPQLIAELKDRGIDFKEVVLHVGRGTFLPISADKIENHVMHEEFFQLSNDTANFLNEAVLNGRRVVAVGTTSVRVLESCFTSAYEAGSGETKIFILPDGRRWSPISGLITNFHLPKSTLLLLTSSFLEHKGVKEPVKKLLELYEIAKKEGYRFFSFGDAMLII